MKALTRDQINIVRNIVSYEPTHGLLTWNERPIHFFDTAEDCERWNLKFAGKPIKGPQIHIPAVGKRYAARVAYIVHTGKDPAGQIIQFKDGDKRNRKWNNLHATTFSELKDANENPEIISLRPYEQFLHECFNYDEDTGDLIWKERPRHHFKSQRGRSIFNTRFKGKPAGSCAGIGGHLQLHFSHINLHVYNSRVVWLLKTGHDPLCRIEHVNGNSQDNRFSNLKLSEC
ncbi:HNH endonuclease [Burkholderia ubonensis]|uniref:HNH endonuclease n=1 Tax=Burkholderia ubonensis TaxID=101571 RepID=UPI0009B34D48|nr:HNH endonuclease [Burkholderia ubonensis]